MVKIVGGKWTHGLSSAVSWWFNVEPYAYGIHVDTKQQNIVIYIYIDKSYLYMVDSVEEHVSCQKGSQNWEPLNLSLPKLVCPLQNKKQRQ